jgi:hypothetical protein
VIQIHDVEQLRELFRTDLEAGKLYWRRPPKHHPRLVGKEAGGARPSHNGKRYWVIKIGRKAVKRGRLVFALAHGRFPAPCVDHINGDSLDDRIANLREATITENAWNHKRRAKRSDLPMGVRTDARGRFVARIRANGTPFHLGTFDTVAEARAAYAAKRKELFGEFA